MKKIFLSLLLLLASTGAIFAQSSLLATLSHEGEITVFYGRDALKEAHAAAQHGDAITLSSGSFKATDITKAITLRGAGMEVDTLKNIYPTIINGGFSILIGDNVSEKLTIEGIYSDNIIYISNGLNNASFLKNRLRTISYKTADGDTLQYKNNRFIHCKVTNGFSGPRYSSSKSLSFSNCYLKNINHNYSSPIFTNCIIHYDGGMYTSNGREYYFTISNLGQGTFYNCIIIGVTKLGAEMNVFPTNSILYNCIATNLYSSSLTSNTSPDRANYVFQNIPYNTNKTIASMDSVFKSFNGTYTDEQNFELVDGLKTSFTGTDGTEIGIHGGSLPFSPTPTNPQITKCNVASRSTADGKLSVDIEVKAGE